MSAPAHLRFLRRVAGNLAGLDLAAEVADHPSGPLLVVAESHYRAAVEEDGRILVITPTDFPVEFTQVDLSALDADRDAAEQVCHGIGTAEWSEEFWCLRAASFVDEEV